MVRHEVTFDDLAFLLPSQRVEDRTQLTTRLPEDAFRRRLGTNTTWYLQSPEWDKL
jgi:hypothetical protein